jgi:hypothetical protein
MENEHRVHDEVRCGPYHYAGFGGTDGDAAVLSEPA